MRTHYAALIVVSLLGSCSVAHSGATSSATSPAVAKDYDPLAGKVLAIKPLISPSATDGALLTDAVNILVRQCMSQHGFTYLPYPNGPRFDGLNVAFRYGHLSIRDAQSMGYRIPQAVDMAKFQEQVRLIDEERARQGPDYDGVLYGATGTEADSDACFPNAMTQIYGTSKGTSGLPEYLTIFNLSVASSTELYADPSIKVVMSQWSQCMSAFGYRYSTWQDARIAVRSDSFSSSPPSAAEIAQAVADATCRASTDLETALYEVENRILNSKLEAAPGSVEALRLSVQKTSDRVKAILATVTSAPN